MTKTEGRFSIEPFDALRHDRAGFSSGVPQVDNFFRLTANKLAKADNLRLFVLTDRKRATIGFYALNAHSVSYADLPSRFQRTRPAHGAIPAGYIAMIGVDHRHQRQGFGAALIADALKRLARASSQIGLAVVLLDVLDCGDPVAVDHRKRLYEGYGFQPLANIPLRYFLPIATARSLLPGGES